MLSLIYLKLIIQNFMIYSELMYLITHWDSAMIIKNQLEVLIEN